MAAGDYNFSNFCIGFIDLLGQRNALANEGLLPTLNNEKDRANFLTMARKSVGQISALQKRASSLIDPLLNENVDSPLRASLPEEKKKAWDETQRTALKQQRWSDGLVLFHSLQEGAVACPMNGVYAVLTTCGCLCFMGIAGGSPIRGAIDVAWAVELNDGEIYGAAVARAYELESQVAQYPRIVVGERLVGYLDAVLSHQDTSDAGKINQSLAKLCKEFLIPDLDGNYIVHYLGESFRTSITKGLHLELYESAAAKIQDALREFRGKKDTKLVLRYEALNRYFHTFKPRI